MRLPKHQGEELHIAAHGRELIVKKLNRDYAAHIKGEERLRFGDASQIREDIAHFEENGTLPRSKVNWY